MIQHFIPSNLNEALEILSKHNCFIFAGGTDLMVQKHISTGVLPHFEKDILYVMGLKELDYINLDNDKNIHIGASTRFIEIEESPLVPEIYKKVVREIASPNIRNMATMTGNIANASPAGDSIVPLVLNDADVVLVSVNGERTISVNDFILGVRKIDRKPDEMIKEIVLKPQELNYFYKKVGSRKAESITKVSFLGAYRVEGGIIKDFRVAFGSVAIKVVRNTKVEKKYIGKSIKELKVNQVVQDYAKLIAPITDQRSNKEYRHKVAMNLLKKFLVDLKGETDE